MEIQTILGELRLIHNINYPQSAAGQCSSSHHSGHSQNLAADTLHLHNHLMCSRHENTNCIDHASKIKWSLKYCRCKPMANNKTLWTWTWTQTTNQSLHNTGLFDMDAKIWILFAVDFCM